MTPIEIIALIFVVFGLIKLLVIAVNPKAWAKVPQKMAAQPVLLTVVSLVLAGVVLYYLRAELSIVQIFGSMVFFMLLMLASFAAIAKDFSGMAEKMLKDRMLIKRMLIPILVWLVLMVCVLVEIFG